MVAIYCGHCGRAHPRSSGFCTGCGSRLAELQRREAYQGVVAAATTGPSASRGHEREADRKTVPERAAAALAGLRQGSGLVVVTDDLEAESRRFVLDSDRATAGRHPDSDIHLDDVTVSRCHAEFLRRGDRFLVCDVGSVNGVYVNRERVTECTLTPRDEIRIGAFRLAFLAA